jgi:dihydrofolate reductase
MGNVIYYLAMSLDGKIADPEGGVEWLEGFQPPEAYGYAAFYEGLGAMVMGAGTYEWFLNAAVDWPYQGLEAVVMTGREWPQPPGGRVRFASAAPGEVVGSLKAAHAGDIWLVGGARLAAAFAEQDLIDEYAITIIPVVLGAGIPLLGPRPGLSHLQSLALVEHRVYPDGVLHLRYAVHRPP